MDSAFQPLLVRFDDYLEVIDTLADPSITTDFYKKAGVSSKVDL